MSKEDVIEAEGGIEVQGSAGHAHATADSGAGQIAWGAYLVYEKSGIQLESEVRIW